MGRYERRDVDYFPFIVKSGRTLELLEFKYRAAGTGFFTNVLRELAKAPDHYIDLSGDFERDIFFVHTKVEPDEGMDMIEMMVKTGKLDADLWQKKSVLASEDFLKNIEDAYRRRSNLCIKMWEIKAKYSLFPPTGMSKTPAETPKTPAEIKKDSGIDAERGQPGPEAKTPAETPKTPVEMPKMPENVGRNAQNSGSTGHSIKEKRREEYIYDFYNSKIDPEQKSSGRAKDNLEYWLKHFPEHELITSINNYATIALARERQFRKDPANFFQKRDPAFKDYLPKVFKPLPTSQGDGQASAPDPYYCKTCKKIKGTMSDKPGLCLECSQGGPAEKGGNGKDRRIADLIKKSAKPLGGQPLTKHDEVEVKGKLLAQKKQLDEDKAVEQPEDFIPY